MKQTVLILVVAAMLVSAAAPSARALINPHFTPVHLVKQSSLILELRFGPAEGGKAAATVTRVVKGEFEGKTVTFTLSTSPYAEHVKTVAKLAEALGGTPALLFAGDVAEGGGDGQKAYLHLAGTWVAFKKGADGWEMVQVSETMGTTWAGGTDMLLRAAEYILRDPDADVPVKEGVQWSHFDRFAEVEGPVHAATPVDLSGDGKLTLHLASGAGDRLFRYDAKEEKLADVTAASRLAAHSKTSAWVDVDADGRMDLVSFDGEALVIHTQQPDGTFRAGEKHLKGALADSCLSLACLDSGTPGRPAVVIGTKRSPLLWQPQEPAKATPIGGEFAGASLGSAGACLVADFDGDHLVDILQPFEKGSLVYKGKAPGRFEDAARCAVTLGAGTTGAFVGDYDGDGRLDVFTVSSEGASGLWSNRGAFAFVDTMKMTGELSYKGASGAVGGATGDFNSDGRQDVLFYYASASPRLYFNRGFRSFGIANGMDIGDHDMLPAAAEGQQAGCFADVDGDGAQDMVLVLKNGEAWVFHVDAGEGAVRSLRAVLSSKGPHVGPLTVTGWQGDGCLGAWNVVAGTSEAIFSRKEAGPVTLKWQLPGGKPGRKTVLLEDRPVRVVLAP